VLRHAGPEAGIDGRKVHTMSQGVGFAVSVVLLAFYEVTAFCAEDEVVLVTGVRVKGEIVSLSEENVVVKTQGAEMVWPLTKVHSITQGGATKVLNPLQEAPALKPKPPATTPSTPTAGSSSKSNAASADAARKKALAALNDPRRVPSWLKPSAFTPQPGRFDEAYWLGRASSMDMREAACAFMGIMNTQSAAPEYPYWLMQFAMCLADLQEDAAAFQVAGRVIAFPPQTATNSAIRAFPNLGSIRLGAQTTRARILARNGLKEEAVEELAGAVPTSGYTHVLLAEAFLLAGQIDSARQMIDKAYSQPTGHPENNWSQVMIQMRAASLARALGDHALTQKYCDPIVAKGQDAQKYPHWKSTWAILDKINALAKAGKHPGGGPFKDGRFEGASNGFDGPIKVSAAVSGGRITAVRVVESAESRPRSAMETIPLRIVQAQTPFVDAVTGATVTSVGIMTAVDEALSNAGR
jgi:uncharacterized protein with FMN-binding domain